MDARLISVLLRCVQSSATRFPVGTSLRAFIEEYGLTVGTSKGSSIYMNNEQKQVIRDILSSEGVDPRTSPDAWKDVTRAEALSLGNNEKLARGNVQKRRIAIKTLSAMLPLDVAGRRTFIPNGSHLDIDYAIAGEFNSHDGIIVVENWECFDQIHRIKGVRFRFENPLVIWRGEKNMVRVDNMLDAIKGLPHPVGAFLDCDPSGLVIANSLPRLAHFIAPPLDNLSEMLVNGIGERYASQLPGCQNALRNISHPEIKAIWEVLEKHGKALPQECFIV